MAKSQVKIKQTAGRDALGEFAPEFARLNDDVLFGEVWSRNDLLSLRDRSIVTVVALMSQGLTDSSFKYHLESAKKNGVNKTEMADEKSRPALGGEIIDLKDYDIVFLGYPIWWNLCPRPVNTFLEKYDFSGKTVIPFATSGGSSITNSVKQLKKLYPKIVWGESRLLNGSVKQAGEWAKGVI